MYWKCVSVFVPLHKCEDKKRRQKREERIMMVFTLFALDTTLDNCVHGPANQLHPTLDPAD